MRATRASSGLRSERVPSPKREQSLRASRAPALRAFLGGLSIIVTQLESPVLPLRWPRTGSILTHGEDFPRLLRIRSCFATNLKIRSCFAKIRSKQLGAVFKLLFWRLTAHDRRKMCGVRGPIAAEIRRTA